MSTNDDWIAAAIKKVRQRSATVPEDVWIQMETLLRGKFGQRLIPPVELASITLKLINSMVPAPPHLEEKK